MLNLSDRSAVTGKSWQFNYFLLAGALCMALSCPVCAAEGAATNVQSSQPAGATSDSRTASTTSVEQDDDDEFGIGADTVETPDPLEDFNRAMFAVNEGLDTVIMIPLATVYDTVLPRVARTGINNFFGNANDVIIGLNNLLQGKPSDALSDLGRIFFNTTIGIGGLFDVASNLGLEKHDEDFGQTLAVWGMGEGAFIYLPVIGPRTIRDTAGWAVDTAGDPVWWILHDDVRWRNSMLGLHVVNTRANLLPLDKIVDEAALDKYAYIRDSYLQRRRHQIEENDSPIKFRKPKRVVDAPTKPGTILSPGLSSSPN